MSTPIQPTGSQPDKVSTPQKALIKLLSPTKPVENLIQIRSSILNIEKNIKEIKGKELQINNYKEVVAMRKSDYLSGKFDSIKYKKEIIRLEDEIKRFKEDIRKDFTFLLREIEKNPQGVILILANIPGINLLKTFSWNCLNTPRDVDGLFYLQKTYFNIRKLCVEDVKKSKKIEPGIVGEVQRDGQAFGAFFGSIVAASRDMAKAKNKDKAFLTGIDKTFQFVVAAGPLRININELIKTLAIAFGTEKANDLKDRLFPKEAPPNPLHGVVTDYPENYNALEKGFSQGFNEFTSEFI